MNCISGTQLKMTIEYSDGQKTNLLLFDWKELFNKLEEIGLNSYPIYSELVARSYIDDTQLLGIDQYYDKGKRIKCISVKEFSPEKNDEGNSDEIIKNEKFKNGEMTIYKQYPHLVEISMKSNDFHYYSILPNVDLSSLTEEEKHIIENQSERLNPI